MLFFSSGLSFSISELEIPLQLSASPETHCILFLSLSYNHHGGNHLFERRIVREHFRVRAGNRFRLLSATDVRERDCFSSSREQLTSSIYSAVNLSLLIDEKRNVSFFTLGSLGNRR